MAEKKNWWITEYRSDESVSCEWLLPTCSEQDAVRVAEAVVDNPTLELEDGSQVRGWSMREATVTIEIRGGCLLDVTGLPYGWEYNLVDYDVMDELDMEEAERDRDSAADI